MAAARLSLVTLGVSDVESATNFYLSLGFERSGASVDGEVSFFRMAGSVLAVYARENMAADAGLAADGSGFRAVSLSMNFDTADEVDQTFAAWTAAGAAALRSPAPTAWGRVCRSCVRSRRARLGARLQPELPVHPRRAHRSAGVSTRQQRGPLPRTARLVFSP
jgi:predicted lactoylglutathione lyase